jgi:hypothetical protein
MRATVALLALAMEGLLAPLRAATPSIPPAVAAMAPRGLAAGTLSLPHIVVFLGIRDRPGLDAMIAAQQDPRSPRFRRWLDPTEIADRFGPRREHYERVRRWFVDRGFGVVADSPYRIALALEGNARLVADALGAPIGVFRYRGQLYHAPLAEPALPADLEVRGLLGLDDLPAFHPLVRLSDRSVAMAPDDFATAYEVTALRDAGLDGTGSSVAVLARSDFDDDDVQTFMQRFVAGARPPRRVMAGATNPGVLTDPIERTEVLLDVQWAAALAPGAALEVVIGSRTGDIPEALVKAVNDRVGDVISLSFGICEPLTTRTATELFDAFYGVANLQGQTVLVAAGDSGATDCAPVSNVVAVNALAASPNSVAVGGTALDPLFDPKSFAATGYGGESAWNDLSGAGGGGVSTVFGRPSFQLGVGRFAGRALPDLALAASPDSPGYVIVEDEQETAVGGTSASVPALAGVLALVNQRVGRGGLGQLLPALYRLARDGDAGLRPSAFHDVEAGGNGFSALRGFDLATGWGSPRAELLANGLVDVPPGPCEPLERCLVPGVPDPRQACAGEWLVERSTPMADAAGLPSRRQSCRDGDPACDRDGVADGTCTMEVALCTNVFDLRTHGRDGLPLCRTGKVRHVRALPPAGGDSRQARRQVLRNLRAAFDVLPETPASLDRACTATVAIPVPLSARGGPGRIALRAAVRRSGATVRPRLMLTCEPAGT